MTDSVPPKVTPPPDTEGPADSGGFARWLGKFKHVKGVIVAIAGGGAVLSGLVGYWTTYQKVKEIAPASAVAAAQASRSALSILVLPIANQTGDAQKAYIADALTTSITSDLSRIRDAFIIPTATALTYKDKALSVQQVGKDAGVRFVLHAAC